MSQISSTEVLQPSAVSSPPIAKRARLGARTAVLLIGAILMIMSVWIGFSRFEHEQHADSLMLTLISLQHSTPYYWEADRYGMLIPLLTAGVRNPLTNMMLQASIGTLAAFCAGFFLVRYFFEKSQVWLVAAALQNVWLLWLASKNVQFNWLASQVYAPALVLGFAALAISR